MCTRFRVLLSGGLARPAVQTAWWSTARDCGIARALLARSLCLYIVGAVDWCTRPASRPARFRSVASSGVPRGVVCRAHVPNPIFLTEVARRAGAHLWLTSGGGGRHPLVSGSWRCRSGSVSVGPCLLFVRLYGRLVRLDTFILDDSSALVSSGSWRCRSGFCFVQSVFAICAALLATSVFGAVLLSSYWFGRLARSRRHDAGVGCGGWFATLLRCFAVGASFEWRVGSPLLVRRLWSLWSVWCCAPRPAARTATRFDEEFGWGCCWGGVGGVECALQLLCVLFFRALGESECF